MPDSTVSRTLLVRPIHGQWGTDQPQDIPDGASPDMLNFQVFNGYIRKRPGITPYGTGFPPTAITGIASVQAQNGQRSLFATTRAGIYVYNPGTTGWDAQVGPALTGADSDLFSFEVSQNNLVFCQGVDKIMALPLTGVVYAAIAATVPAKYITRWNQRLYSAFTIEGGVNLPFRVRWSVNSDHTDWTSIGSGFVDLADDVFQLRGLRKIQNNLAIYTEKGIYIATKTGSITGPAQFDQVVKDIGLLIPFSLRGYNTNHLIFASDNIALFNGLSVTPTSPAIRTRLFAQLSNANFLQGYSLDNQETQEYINFIPVDPSVQPSVAWVYNWQKDCSYPWQFTSSLYNCGGTHVASSDTTISQLVGTIASQTWVLGSRRQAMAFPALMLGETTGRVMRLSNAFLYDDVAGAQTPIACRWTSKDYTAADIDPNAVGRMLSITSVGVSYIDPGTAFTLAFSFSVDRGTTWSGPYNLTVGGVANGAIGDAMLTQQVTGRRVRFKVENNTANEDPRIINFQPCLELRAQTTA